MLGRPFAAEATLRASNTGTAAGGAGLWLLVWTALLARRGAGGFL